MTLPSNSTYDEATVLNPSSAVTDFSLIVDLSRMSAAWWSAAEDTNKRRMRFAKDDGTELPFDAMEYDHALQTGWVRVKWTGSLAASGTQKLRVYPPVSTNGIYVDTDTYGKDNAYDSDWVAYWPLSSDDQDRTGNGLDLTASGTSPLSYGGAIGKLGNATLFDGVDQMAQCGSSESSALFDSGEMSVVAWASRDTGTWLGIMSRARDSNISIEFDLRQRGVSDDISLITEGTTEIRGGSIDGAFHMYFASADASGSVLLDNNVSIGTGTGTFTANTSNSAIRLGKGAATTTGYWDGTIEHAQVHKTVRDSSWATQEYDQTNDQAAFWGTWTNVPASASSEAMPCGIVRSKQVSGSRMKSECLQNSFVR